jgi:shikimate dehydrogenase
MELMDDVDPAAREIGAINTIVFKNEQLYGYNTDWNGFKMPLKKAINAKIKGEKAVVLGAGGAARAVIFALADEGCSVISIFNRTQERTFKIKRQYKNIFPQCEIKSFPFQTIELQKEINNADLLINTTPLGSWYYPGQKPLSEDIKLPTGIIVYDLIYHPDKTPLLHWAEMNGNKILNGMPMLVYQAAESFYLWTGIYPDQEIIFQTLRQMKQEEKL